MPTRQSILFFCEGVSFAHVARSKILAGWIRELGYPLTVACSSAYSHLFAEDSLEVIPLRRAEPSAVYGRLRRGGPMYVTEDLLGYFEEDDRILRKVQPQLVVSEFRFTAMQLAKKYGIRSVGLTEATCHPHFKPDGTVPDSFAQPRFLPLPFLDFVSQRTPVGPWLTGLTIRKISEPLREASRRYGVEQLPTFFDYASQGDVCLLCDHPDLIPVCDGRPGDLYTGALRWEQEEALPDELSRLDPKRKTVYVSLGTQESLATGFIPAYVSQILKRGAQVVLSRGNRSFDLDLRHDDRHEDLFVVNFVNDSKLLPLVDAMVYPGGAMSTYQALLHGVPLIVLPAHANQHFYAEAIARNNLGRFFRPSRLNVRELADSTMELLSNELVRRSVEGFQKRLLAFDGKEAVLSRVGGLLVADERSDAIRTSNRQD